MLRLTTLSVIKAAVRPQPLASTSRLTTNTSISTSSSFSSSSSSSSDSTTTATSSSSPSSSSLESTTTTTASESEPIEAGSDKTHYLITLRRSPLHLPSPIQSSCKSLGLGHRLASSIVPITQENAGYILRIKELITVKTIGVEEISRAVDQSWSLREGEGRRGSGLHLMREGAGVIRVGTERSRGEERGFKVLP